MNCSVNFLNLKSDFKLYVYGVPEAPWFTGICYTKYKLVELFLCTMFLRLKNINLRPKVEYTFNMIRIYNFKSCILLISVFFTFSFQSLAQSDGAQIFSLSWWLSRKEEKWHPPIAQSREAPFPPLVHTGGNRIFRVDPVCIHVHRILNHKIRTTEI